MFSSNARYSQSYESIPESADEHCEVCGKPTNSLSAIPDVNAEPMLACLTCLLKSFEAA